MQEQQDRAIQFARLVIARLDRAIQFARLVIARLDRAIQRF